MFKPGLNEFTHGLLVNFSGVHGDRQGGLQSTMTAIDGKDRAVDSPRFILWLVYNESGMMRLLSLSSKLG